MIPKFRVWLPDPDVERMLRVKALVFESDKTRCICGYAYDFYLEDENAIIMQATGLLDKNGQEVFVGDIIKCTRGCPHEVYLEKEYGGTYVGPNFKFFQVLPSYTPCSLFAVSSLYCSLCRITSDDVLVRELLLSNI